MESITTSLTDSLSTLSTEVISAIGDILPYALAVMGAIVVINVGIRIFRRVAK